MRSFAFYEDPNCVIRRRIASFISHTHTHKTAVTYGIDNNKYCSISSVLFTFLFCFIDLDFSTAAAVK